MTIDVLWAAMHTPTDRSTLARRLRTSIVEALRRFRQDRPDDHPYAFALIGGQGGDYVGFAVATEQDLLRTARSYAADGYRCNRAFAWAPAEEIERLATWLRWANPDDGWTYGDFDDAGDLSVDLTRLCGDAERPEDELESFCVDEVLVPLVNDPTWAGGRVLGSLTFGFTTGEDPQQFLRSATRVNAYPRVRDLWRQFEQAEELGRRVVRG
jgi:hypothetical protein